MAILVPILFAMLLVLLFGVLVVFIVLRACSLAVSETGQFSRDEEKQAAAKGLLYDDPTEPQEVSSFQRTHLQAIQTESENRVEVPLST